MMLTSDFDYYLPDELIAQKPLDIRSDSRLLVYHKNSKAIEHRTFTDIVSFLNKDDMLIFNSTKVLPLRIYGNTLHGGKVEILLLTEIRKNVWECLFRPGRKAKPESEFLFGDNLKARCLESKDGIYFFEMIYDGNFLELLSEVGVMPLPPYIKEKLQDNDRYQTVFAKELGSSAAPTAGLHFTDAVLNELKELGVEVSYINLEIGLGTFKPVDEDIITDHKMHNEVFHIKEKEARKINKHVDENKRLIFVGTTSLRAVESAYQDKLLSGDFETDIFIYPGYKFKACKNLLTNFHLPKSTLLMLVSALIGRDEAIRVYEEAVKERYRFFSFGDAMLILDD